jgi:hypothetical protein
VGFVLFTGATLVAHTQKANLTLFVTVSWGWQRAIFFWLCSNTLHTKPKEAHFGALYASHQRNLGRRS